MNFPNIIISSRQVGKSNSVAYEIKKFNDWIDEHIVKKDLQEKKKILIKILFNI